ncbi:IS256 family transposase [Facilibium subflavum]|uniref:IS256 family transposase n=2 Tax=Facilibium subflavum TaxID=2219058 RepID=UPI000E65B875|nr:IS256 family transposase [Facilibium subflavum]
MKNKEQNKALDQALDLIVESGADLSNLFKSDGVLKQLTKGLVERALQGELKAHLGYDRHERSNSANARNGTARKSVITEDGLLEIDVPRDRSGEFDPVLVPKRSTRIEGLNEKIISLYAKGMSVSDIQLQLQELYGGAEISTSLISKITDEVLEEVKHWQSRPLDAVYPIVFFDCLVVKVRQDKRVLNKAVYVALGIDRTGRKDVLGLWMSENEGAKFWLANLTELKNRGVQDILIACTDNLTGMSDAISAAFPKTEHQLCIVHQIRNSLNYVSYKQRKEVAADLKPIYTAATEESALMALEAFAQKWDKQYPHIAKSWYANWDNLVVFMQYPDQIRKVIYTTNAIESVNSQLRKVTKNKRSFPNDNAVFKTLFLAIDYMTKKWTMPIRSWSEAMPYFLIKFEGRI